MVKSFYFFIIFVFITPLSAIAANLDEDITTTSIEAALHNKEGYNPYMDINWGGEEIKGIVEAYDFLDKVYEEVIWPMIVVMRLDRINYTEENKSLIDDLSKSDPIERNSLEFQIDRIIKQNAQRAAIWGAVVGASADVLLTKKISKEAQDKIIKLVAIMKQTLLFATADAIVSTKFFLRAYFQIANRLGWMGDYVTRDIGKLCIFHVISYYAYVYTFDASVAGGLQYMGVLLIKNARNQFMTQEEVQTFKVWYNAVKLFARKEFWATHLRTVGLNLPDRAKVISSEMENSYYAQSLKGKRLLLLNALIQGGISAVSSYSGVYFGLKLMKKYFFKYKERIRNGAVNDLREIVATKFLFNMIVSSIYQNTSSAAGYHTIKERKDYSELFKGMYITWNGFGANTPFHDDPDYLKYLRIIAHKENPANALEPSDLTSLELKIDDIEKLNFETIAVLYVVCYYMVAYDGLSIQDSYLPEAILKIDTLVAKAKISSSQKLFLFEMRNDLGSMLNSERINYSKNPKVYKEKHNGLIPEQVALDMILAGYFIDYDSGLIKKVFSPKE